MDEKEKQEVREIIEEFLEAVRESKKKDDEKKEKKSKDEDKCVVHLSMESMDEKSEYVSCHIGGDDFEKLFTMTSCLLSSLFDKFNMKGKKIRMAAMVALLKGVEYVDNKKKMFDED